MLDNTYEELEFYIERHRYNDAKKLIANKLPESPNDSNLLYYSAYIDYQNNDLAQARTTLSKLLENDPHDFSARTLAFHTESELDNLAEAERIVLALLHEYPQSSDLYCDYARLMLDTLHFEKSERLAKEALRLNPENERALFLSAQINIINKKTQNDEFTKLLAKHPDQLHATSVLITKLLDENKLNEAQALVSNALRADPRNDYLLSTAKELKYINHWSMKPITWLGKFGVSGSVFLWLGIIVLVQIGKRIPDPTVSQALLYLVYGYLGFCIYTWVYPSIFKKFYLR